MTTIDTEPSLETQTETSNNEVEELTPKRHVNIQILPKEDMLECSFWIGIFKKGSQDAHDLLSGDKYHSIMHSAAEQGIDSNEPVMLANTEAGGPKFIYLLPQPTSDFNNQMEWITDLVSTIKGWENDKLGVYIDEQIINPNDLPALVTTISRELIAQTNVTDLFLTPTSDDENLMLNIALDIKRSMENEEPDVDVYH
jgi:hypothetical protein